MIAQLSPWGPLLKQLTAQYLRHRQCWPAKSQEAKTEIKVQASFPVLLGRVSPRRQADLSSAALEGGWSGHTGNKCTWNQGSPTALPEAGGPQCPTVAASTVGAGAPSAAFMSSLFHVQLHLVDRDTQPRSGGRPGHVLGQGHRPLAHTSLPKLGVVWRSRQLREREFGALHGIPWSSPLSLEPRVSLWQGLRVPSVKPTRSPCGSPLKCLTSSFLVESAGGRACGHPAHPPGSRESPREGPKGRR